MPARFCSPQACLFFALWQCAVAAAPETLDIAQDCGCIADNSTSNTRALQACLDRAGARPGSTVLVPRGVFLTATVTVPSYTRLLFQAGGWLQGSNAKEEYGEDWDYWHVVQSLNSTNVTLAGECGSPSSCGIHGNMWGMVGAYDPTQRDYIPRSWAGWRGCVGECRVKNLALIDARSATVSGFALLYASDWTSLFRRCRGLSVARMFIRSPPNWPNGDGMDLESGEDIAISQCDIATGDDSIAMRSGNCNPLRTPWPEFPISPLRNVTVTRCSLSSSSSAIKVENLFQRDHGNISGVLVDACTITSSNRGVGVWQRVAGPSGGAMSNLVFSNLHIQAGFVWSSNYWGSGEALVVTSVPEDAGQEARGLPGIHGIRFENITAFAENGALFAALGQATTNPLALTGLVLRNVSLTIGRWSTPQASNTFAQHDFRPLDAGAPCPELIPAPVNGLYLEGIADGALQGVAVAFAPPSQPYWSAGGRRSPGSCFNISATAHVSISPDCTCTPIA